MSAGAAAGAPGGDAGQAQGEAQQGQGEGQGQGPTTAEIAQALAAGQASQQEMFEYLRSEPWKAQEQQQTPQEPDPLDLSFLGGEDGFGPDPQQIATRLGDAIEQAAQQRLQQGLAPIQEQMTQFQQQQAEMRREQEYGALIGEFPELGDEQTAGQVLQSTGQLAQMSGHPELAGEPWLVRLVYMAGRAADAAQQEEGEIPSPGHMESGAGAAPAGGSGAMTADQIVNARRGASVLPFT